jgi:hypothetical protein
MTEIDKSKPAGVSRRTVTKAMAWSVPAIAVAATTPMAAASCIPQVGVAPGSCKKANASSYYLILDLEGDPTCDAPIDCTGQVFALRYAGNNEIFWGAENGPPTAFGTGISICNINPANFIEAYVSISCINNGAPFWTPYTIDMPQISNGKCVDDPTFCPG